ncbi:MAG TPA: RICIN domain-containing protein [Patescibacteria group bacterium]
MKRLVKYYYLSPTHCDSNRVLEVLDFRHHDRARLGLGFLKPGAANQMWAFIPRADGFYEIINKHSLKVLDDCRNSGDPGGEVYQFQRHLGENQQWRVRQADGPDRVQIISRPGNLVLDVAQWSRDRHAAMVLWRNENNANQIWRLIPA